MPDQQLARTARMSTVHNRTLAIDFRLMFAYDGCLCKRLPRSIGIRPLPGIGLH